ncbi:MAG: hypothetical protein F4X36_04680, partial [Gammaproteobacteria bacterium]|nr:hypothetical protein [Gammaproteobacteria bacterium]
MDPPDAFGRILGLLHCAALDDARWPDATALIEEAVGTAGSTLTVGEGFGDDVRLHFARILQRGHGREDLAREYFNVYLPHDEGIPRLRRRPHGELVHVPDLYTEDERKTSPVYNEGLRRMGSREGLLVRFDGPDGLRVIWGCADPVGGSGWESGQLRLVERLLPHIHRTVLTRQALAAAEALGAGLAGLLDHGGIGVVHLDRGGRVLAANDVALDVLRRGEGL